VKSTKVQVSAILLSDGSHVFVGNQAPLFTGTLSSSGIVELVILYGNETGDNPDNFAKVNATLLQIRNMSDLANGGWFFCVLSSGIDRCFFDEFIEVRSLVVSVPRDGFYFISAERDGRIGLFAELDRPPGFDVNSSSLIIAAARLEWMESKTPTPNPTPRATESLPFCPTKKLPIRTIARPGRISPAPRATIARIKRAP
jgi:hypothetical protein